MTGQTLLIGIDDTDVAEGPGTGRRARELARLLSDCGMGATLGVTRHQLLVDPRIPYTSHNSSLCVALESGSSVEQIADKSKEFLLGCCPPGSDPGLCIAWAGSLGASMLNFAETAQRRVLSKEDALRQASSYGLFLEELGGSGGGVIGAMAAVGLRAGGNDGRFVDLQGIRDLHEECLLAGEILERTEVASIRDQDGNAVPLDSIVQFGGWLRPSLRGGCPVLVVRRAEGTGPSSIACGMAVEKGWITVEYKHKSAGGSKKTHHTLFHAGSPPGDHLGSGDRGEQEVP